MKSILIASLFGSLLILSLPADAHRSHHRHVYASGHHHRHYGGYGYRHHHRHHRYGYLAAGLVLGAVLNDYAHRPAYVERRVIYRRDVGRYPRTERYQPALLAHPDQYLRREANGDCYLVETGVDGEQIITPQDPAVCSGY